MTKALKVILSPGILFFPVHDSGNVWWEICDRTKDGAIRKFERETGQHIEELNMTGWRVAPFDIRERYD